MKKKAFAIAVVVGICTLALTACSVGKSNKGSTENTMNAISTLKNVSKADKPTSYDYSDWNSPLWQGAPEINMPKAKIVKPGAFALTSFGQTAKLGDLSVRILGIRDASQFPPTSDNLKHEDYTLAIDLEVRNGGKFPVQLQPESARFLLVNLKYGKKYYTMYAPINEGIRNEWRSMVYSVPVSVTLPDVAVPYNDLPAFLQPGKTADGTLIFDFGPAGMKLPPGESSRNPFDINNPKFALAVVENGDQLGAQTTNHPSIYGWGLLDAGDLKMKNTGQDRYKQPPYPTNDKTYPGWGGQQHWVKPGERPQMVPSPQPSMENYKTEKQENVLLEKLFPSSAIASYAERYQNTDGTVKLLLNQGKFDVSTDVKKTSKDAGSSFRLEKLMNVTSEFSYIEQEAIASALVWHLTITNESSKPLAIDSRDFAVVIKKNGGDIFQIAESAGLAWTDTMFGSPSGMVLQGENLLPLDMPWKKIAPGQTVQGSIVFPIYNQLGNFQRQNAMANTSDNSELTWNLLVLGTPQRIQNGDKIPVLAEWEHKSSR